LARYTRIRSGGKIFSPVLGIFEASEVFMRVILIENVSSLGKAGDIVQVAEGYGRNFLVPKKLALEASRANLRHLEQQREAFLSKATNEKQRATEVASRIEDLPCTLSRPAGENEKLFGSVTTMDLQRFLQEQGISLDRRKIFLSNPIKALGTYTVPLKLHPEVTAQLKVNVVAAPRPDKE
jgi:large subunit ribosomal protein L9